MDRLTATIMLANDPSLVLVFTPTLNGRKPSSYVYCNACAVKSNVVYRSLWGDVADGYKEIHVVGAKKIVNLCNQSYCDGCYKRGNKWTD